MSFFPRTVRDWNNLPCNWHCEGRHTTLLKPLASVQIVTNQNLIIILILIFLNPLIMCTSSHVQCQEKQSIILNKLKLGGYYQADAELAYTCTYIVPY